MDPDAKKTALRMIPYGLYVLMSESADGKVSAAAVSWVTQASFEPALVVVGVRKDSLAHSIVQETGSFSLNMLGKDQQSLAFTFFKPQERDGQTIGGEPFRAGTTGAPILENAPAFVECKVVDTVGKGDHSIVVAEVVDAGVSELPEGRPDEALLWVKDLGENIHYGG